MVIFIELVISIVRYGNQKSRKSYQVHRFTWECYNGLIPDNKVIDHINDDRKDNRLCNLQLITTQQNNKKAAKNRDYSFVKNNHQNRKCVKAVNQTTKEVTYYNSMYAIHQHLRINSGIVKMASEKLNNVKSGISKKDGCNYIFEYVNKEDLLVEHIKSSDLRTKLFEEFKQRCIKYEDKHNKICDSQKQ